MPQMQLNIHDPEKKFDNKKVRGLVARLIQVKDPCTTTALEVTAGGKVSLNLQKME